MVSDDRLTLRLTPTTSTEPCTRVACTSRPVSGAKRISASCEYCESQLMSAPRSIMPCWISKTKPTPPAPPAAYVIATALSDVVDTALAKKREREGSERYHRVSHTR